MSRPTADDNNGAEPLMRGFVEPEQSLRMLDGVAWPAGEPPARLDGEVARLAVKYRPLACEILREAVRVTKDSLGDDPDAGTSNHEEARVRYLRRAIVEHGAVESEDDVGFDGFGNLRWEVRGEAPPGGGRPTVVWMEGHTDTVAPLRDEWARKTGGGIDAHDGLVRPEAVDERALRDELGVRLPPRSEWGELIFGRGAADQLNGVVAQIVATKILLELRELGSLPPGVVVVCYGTVAEEDNDGGGPLWVIRNVLPGNPDAVPDAVIHTEPTGDANKGPLGIYIGQRGRVQVEVEVVGTSSHGSMPWVGRNPLEYGSLILAEAQRQAASGDAFLSDPFLGSGTRVASWCEVSTPSTCAVPAAYRFRFDRRLTVGETPDRAADEIRGLRTVREAGEHGFQVHVTVPRYTKPSWRGTPADNAEAYMGWLTPPDHPCVQAAYEAWMRTVARTPALREPGTHVPERPRVDRWIFSTDGVAYPRPKEGLALEPKPLWVDAGAYVHPPMIGIGIGLEQVCHKTGEFVDSRLFPAAIAVMARFVSAFDARNRAQRSAP